MIPQFSSIAALPAQLVTAFALCASAIPAAAQSFDVLQTFSRDDLKAAIEASGATHEESEDGRTLNVKFGTGINANAALLACQQESEGECYGTSVLATFEKPSSASVEDVRLAINDYNYKENFGRAYLDPDGRISVRLYIISDGGIARRNYERQFELWENSLVDFLGYLYKSDQTSEA